MLCLRTIFALLLLSLFGLSVNAQHKMPSVIDAKEKRKVERGRKLLNQYKLFEGEKIFVELRDKHINHAYFHEALVMIQKQILDQIEMANNTMQDEDFTGEDYEEDESDLEGEDLEAPIEERSALTYSNAYIDNGLLRTVDEKKATQTTLTRILGRKSRRKMNREVEKDTAHTEALVTIDSSLIKTNSAQQLLEEMDGFDDMSKEEKSRKLAALEKRQFKELLNIPYDAYRDGLIANCRKATLYLPQVDSASHLLRILLVDTVNYLELLNDVEQEEYELALSMFRSLDFRHCMERLEPLVEKHVDFFDGQLMKAKCLMKIGADSAAYAQYGFMAGVWTERPEPRMGLSDYYLKKGKYKSAAVEIIRAIMIYPEDAYVTALHNMIGRANHKYDEQWIRREVYPITTANNFEEIAAKEKSPWVHYQMAKTLAYSYAHPETGVLRENDLTKERYLEVYGWLTMLERSFKMKEGQKGYNNFPFARAMQKIGYLDCYALITLFHHDQYASFKDLVENNPGKVRSYFDMLINWEDEKFDKYKKL